MAKNPKYIEIANYFIEKIKNSELKPNDALESEEVLCSKFNVSHMTMTKAMNELSLEGYIKRTPGKGTFVSDNYKASIKKAFSSRSSITSQIIEAGMEPRTELYRYYIIKGKDLKGVAENLNVDDNEFIHGFIRLRYAGEKMMAISYTYIVQKMIPTIDISRLEGSSINMLKNWEFTDLMVKPNSVLLCLKEKTKRYLVPTTFRYLNRLFYGMLMINHLN